MNKLFITFQIIVGICWLGFAAGVAIWDLELARVTQVISCIGIAVLMFVLAYEQ